MGLSLVSFGVGKAAAWIAKAASKKQVASGIQATVDVRKFSEYALNHLNPKSVVFKSFGYTQKHAKKLVRIYKKQGLKNFNTKNFSLGKLGQYGQRMTIVIKLKGKGKTGLIKSGWMLDDSGIRLITPFSGFL